MAVLIKADAPGPFARDRWDAVEASYPEILDGIQARVHRREVAPADADWELLRPFVAARNGRTPTAQLLRGAPAKWSSAVEYGYDEHDQILIARRFRDMPGRERQLEEERVLWQQETETVQLLFHHDPRHPPQLLYAVVGEFIDGRLTGTVTYFNPSRGEPELTETYGYDTSGRLTQIQTAGSTYLLTHDDDSLATILVQAKGTPREDAWPVYRRALAGDQLKARRMVEERLPGSVAQWAARQAPAGAVYCLALSYSLEGLVGGPNLALGTYAELERWRSRQRREELATTMWNPAEFDLLDTQPEEILEDPELMDAFQKLAQAWNATDDDAGLRKLMVKVAKSVALLDLGVPGGSLGQPVVYAVDLEQDDLERNLRALVPLDVRRALERGAATS